MPSTYEIRADFTRDTVVVYQAYNDAIADAALGAQTFAPPFSMGRMTWIKPSFLWLMHRSQWGQKKGQERTLAVRITRQGWDEALGLGVLTSPDGPVFGQRHHWERAFARAEVHIQWDPERSLRGQALDHYSIQVGLSRHIIQRFVSEWIVAIEDLTPLVARARQQLLSGRAAEARKRLPPEKLYPVDGEVARRLLIQA